MSISLPVITLTTSLLGLVLGLYCLWQSLSLRKLRKNFFAGNSGADLEHVIVALREELKDSRRQQEVLEIGLNQLKKDFTFAVQKVGLVRFNPFDDGGGNFSFCLALLNAHNSGVVITSMYGREQNRIYTKKIDSGGSEAQLSAEETEAVILANQKPKISEQRN